MGNNSILHELARAKAAFQLRAIEAVICAPAHGSKHDQNMQETPMITPDTDTLAGLREELRLIGCHQNGDARCTCAIGADALDAIDALRAHQPAAPVSGVTVREAGWRPIETAPHEELVVLGWQENGVWKQEIALASAGERFPNGYSNMWAHGCATHWMPLPEPPAALLPAGEGE